MASSEAAATNGIDDETNGGDGGGLDDRTTGENIILGTSVLRCCESSNLSFLRRWGALDVLFDSRSVSRAFDRLLVDTGLPGFVCEGESCSAFALPFVVKSSLNTSSENRVDLEGNPLSLPLFLNETLVGRFVGDCQSESKAAAA